MILLLKNECILSGRDNQRCCRSSSVIYSFKINVALLALLGGRDTKTLGMSTHAHILPHSHNLEDMGGDNTEPNILVLMKLKGMCIITGGEDTQTSNCMA